MGNNYLDSSGGKCQDGGATAQSEDSDGDDGEPPLRRGGVC